MRLCGNAGFVWWKTEMARATARRRWLREELPLTREERNRRLDYKAAAQ
uniref:Uncharacterized protein n=1 Tax=Rhizophora mucronata TaxID=61149 RepID=A0A2P2N4M7_RHIMU